MSQHRATTKEDKTRFDPPNDPDRFAGIRRDYGPADIERLAGSFRIRHTLAEMGAARLWPS
jgi:isocitrate lyase